MEIYRYGVAIGAPDEPHRVTLRGTPLTTYVEYDEKHGELSFWATHDEDNPESVWSFLAVGTGWEVPDSAQLVGTAPRGSDGLVWHLLALASPQEVDAQQETEVTKINIYDLGPDFPSVSVNGSWVGDADHEELEELANRLSFIATEMKERHERNE
jgi:hypothetical protein